MPSIKELKKEKKTPLQVEVNEELLKQIKAISHSENISLRALVEYGFKKILEERKSES